jgi:predicted Zn-dependent protease
MPTKPDVAAKPNGTVAGAAATSASPGSTPAAAPAVGPSPGKPAVPAVAPVLPGATAPAVAAAPVVPPSPFRPFAEVIKDAKETKGLITLWKKEDRVWAELKPEQFNQPFLFAAQRSTGIGTRGLFAHWMLGNYIVEFRRVGANGAGVQMIARNFAHQATNNPALQRAVASSFSDSLIATTGVASQPHPTRKSVLVDLNSLLLSDLPQMTATTEALFRIGYGFDSRNSFMGDVHANKDQAVVEVKAHYYVPRVPMPNPGGPAPNFATPTPPSTLEDPRSFFVTFNYSFAALPEKTMAPRLADDRIGHFVERVYEFGDEADYKERRYFVNRWRLEKKDPSAALSEPVKPITYWLDRNIPERYRESVKAGVLEWNKAFEKIGFKNAVRVEMEPDKDGPILAGTGHSSIRWFLNTDPGALAIGPSIVDPRSGEILDADIAISNNWVRLLREVVVERSPNPSVANEQGSAESQWSNFSSSRATSSLSFLEQAKSDPMHALSHALGKPGRHVCDYGSHASMDMIFGAQLLQMRGVIEPGSAEVEKLVQAVLKDVVMHEVGHTLGLRHNYRASTITPASKLADTAWTKANGISGSVMDYNGFNIPVGKEKYSSFVMETLGPYDYWAIEYAYRPLATNNEANELAAIASRSSEPQLAYGTDDEARIGYDPEVNPRDLGDDPLAYAARRFQQARELWQRTAERQLRPGESYGVLRRVSDVAFAQFDQAADLSSKWVGGVRYLRDHSGSARAPYQPVPVAKQREALQMIAKEVLAPDALKFDPGFVARLVEDNLDRGNAPPMLPGVYRDIAGVQQRVLNRLMSDNVAQRLLEAETKLADRSQILSLSEVYRTLQDNIWSELASGADIGLQRRTLQREYLRKLTSLVLRPGGLGPVDTRAMARMQAQDLMAKLKRANASGVNAKGGRSAEARAHLAESFALVEDSLKAPLVRQGG